jgi:tRNA A37 methylthiotransferase MiaB
MKSQTNPSRTFTIIHGSCNRRQEEIDAAGRFLIANGWREEGRVERSDLVLVFACGAFRVNVDDMLAKIASVRRQIKDGAEIIVGGCLPLTAAEALKTVFSGKTITYADSSALDSLPGITRRFETLPRLFGPEAAGPPLVRPGRLKSGALRIIRPASRLARPLLRRPPASALRKIASRLDRYGRMAISIAAGCSRTCPYCAKRFGFGPLRSKPAGVILQRIREGTKEGIRAFDLLADSIGDYGRDLGTDLRTLLNRIADFEGRFTIGLYDLHAQDFVENFEAINRLLRMGRLHFLYVIAESGNERVLKSMNRAIDTADLAAKLLAVRAAKNVFLQTTILVGYPGETDGEFADTLALLQKIDFDNVFVHSYCDMPNTESSRLAGKATPETLSKRLQKLAAAGIKHNISEARRECDHASS